MKYNLTSILYASLVLASFLNFYGCKHSNSDNEGLNQIADIVSDSPKEAMRRLANIDVYKLSESDRHFHDLLSIKAADKAYMQPTSDSLILDVIEYYKDHDKDLYPEALYYGGRVYSDLGDKPRALEYFHLAINNEPEKAKDPDLKINLLSQTAGLLNSLRLYNQAIPYAKESLKMWLDRKDTIKAINDLHLLGDIYLRWRRFDSSEYYFRKSLDLSRGQSRELQSKSKMLMAAMFRENGVKDSALYYINGVAKNVDSIYCENALTCAALIYMDVQQYDSALSYADQIIHRPLSNNTHIGYHIVLSPQVRSYLNQDSLERYLSSYIKALEETDNGNMGLMAIQQETDYNYSFQVRENKQIKKSMIFLTYGIIVIALLALGLGIALMILKFRYNRKVINIQKAIIMIEHLARKYHTHILEVPQVILSENLYDNNKNPGPLLLIGHDNCTKGQNNFRDSVFISEISEPEEDNGKDNSLSRDNEYEDKGCKATRYCTKEGKLLESIIGNEAEYREQLKKELMDLAQISENVKHIPESILQSEAYNSLQTYIKNKREIKENDPLWVELEKVVLEASPNFKKNLRMLLLGKLSYFDLSTAILIKCGVSPSQIAILFNRHKATIVSRRDSISTRIFGKKIGTKVIDAVIRLL